MTSPHSQQPHDRVCSWQHEMRRALLTQDALPPAAAHSLATVLEAILHEDDTDNETADELRACDPDARTHLVPNSRPTTTTPFNPRPPTAVVHTRRLEETERAGVPAGCQAIEADLHGGCRGPHNGLLVIGG